MNGGTGTRVKQVSGGQEAQGHGYNRSAVCKGHGDTPPHTDGAPEQNSGAGSRTARKETCRMKNASMLAPVSMY